MSFLTRRMHAFALLSNFAALLAVTACIPTQFIDNGFQASPKPEEPSVERPAINPAPIEEPTDHASPFAINSIAPTKHGIYRETPPDAIVIPVTIRDFKDTHPDFEKFEKVPRTPKLVEDLLSNDGLPVFNKLTNGQDETGYRVIASPESFAQWFRDVDGVNQKQKDTFLQLKMVEPGKYSYNADEFFPIDGKGFGNQDREHNYHFTAHIDTKFVYRGGEVFTFKGDDDVWVFINNRLAVDLGGVHNEAEMSVALDDLKASHGLEINGSYPLTIFYAERKYRESHFRMETTIALENHNKPFTYQVTTNAPAGDVVSFSLEQGPAGMSMDPTGKLSWSPTLDQLGSSHVVVKATKNDGQVVTQAFDLFVVEESLIANE